MLKYRDLFSPITMASNYKGIKEDCYGATLWNKYHEEDKQKIIELLVSKGATD